MDSTNKPVIAIEFQTTLKKITDWLDYYRVDWPVDFDPRPVIYLKPTMGGHDQRHYYLVLAAPELKVVPFDEYVEEDITQIDPGHMKLGLVRVDEINQNTIRLFVWSEVSTPPEIWNDLFDKLMMVFHPEKPFPQMVDGSLLKFVSDQHPISALTKEKTGRKPDKNYDEAYERLQKGDDLEEVFEWYLDEVGIKFPDKGVRDSFMKAIKRRQNST